VRAIDDYPGDDAAKCQAVKDAVTYDGASGTVTFHLDHAFSPFLSILATQWGAALDKDWMEENGGWGGNCADWRAYHDPAAEESILFDRANGTGPFQLEDWSGGEVVLARHTEYWLTDPLWARGPAGPPALERIVIKSVNEWEARYEMLVSGDADTAYVPSQYTSTLEPFIWERYEAPEDDSPTFVNPTTGTLRLHQNLPTMSSVDLFFVFDIDTSEPNPYIGSGAFDGDGIRPDFFSDLHVRKAFNYAFDWTTFISDTWGGEARQRRGPIPAGLPGFDEAQPTYVYSPTLSRQAFQQAWGGQLWTSGFSMTLAYNTGNDQRRRACEILKQGVESITDTFQVNVVGVPWGEYLNDMVAGRLPAFVLGWHQDYHHPHNWVVPYMHTTGTFASWQGFPVTLTTQFDAKINACQALAPAEATVCYEELQQMAYDNAIDIFLGQPVDRRYQRTEVRGWYHQPALSGPYYYALRKGPAPAIRSVPPDAVSAATYTSTTGLTTTLEVPAGGVPEATVLAYAPDLFVYDDPDGLRFAGRAFALDAYQDDERVPDFAFTAAATVTLSYREGPDEERLRLYAWRGDGWTDAACGPYRRDTADNTLAVPICQLSDFALFEAMRRIYLPVTLRSF
jgi:peptide/nickel transport system substrate-binding protein